MLALLTLICGCSKPQDEVETEVLDEIDYLKMKEVEGTYLGTITATYFNTWLSAWLALEEDAQLLILEYYPLLNDPPIPPFTSGNATLELKDGKFTCIQEYRGSASGNYSIIGDKIIFNAEGFWQCDFDTGLILCGEYDYIFDGQKLKIFKDRGRGETYSIIINDIEYVSDLEFISLYEYDLEKK